MIRVAAFFCLVIIPLLTAPVTAATSAEVVVFAEAGFVAVDSPTPTSAQLGRLFPGARFSPAEQLNAALGESGTQLLVLPYGSAFPEQAWGDIQHFLQRGGNLLVIGGRPFTRSAYHDTSGWHLRDYSVRFTRPLMIDQYQVTPGSEGLEFETNSDLPVQLPRFTWKQAFSPVIRLSAVDLYKRGGSAGSIDARVDTFAWGASSGRKLAAPAIEIDHLRNGFDGGRWIFLNAELASDFYAAAVSAEMIKALTARALQGSEEFTVRPTLPLYLPGEPIELNVRWHSARPSPAPLTLKVTSFPEAEPANPSVMNIAWPLTQPVMLPAPTTKGFHIVQVELSESNQVRARYTSAFWIRDEAYLRSGPRLTVNRDYFEVDGRPIAVVGTTYMSSEVQRLYFQHSNAYVWNRDLAQIHNAGLNMIRTGWWTGWDKFCDENGQPYERTLRTLEAFLMTARKNGLPVQFNFFAFLPDVLGGMNAYLDPAAVRKQQTLIAAVVARFRDVPFVAWDLINEPSISQHLWTMRPNGDPFEVAKWNQWLSERYPDRAALAAMWNVTPDAVAGTIPLPEDIEFTPRGMYVGHNSLKVYDYFLFAQSVFGDWVRAMRQSIRDTGSKQLVTVGQDEGGIQDRLHPAFWGELVDFTTNHSWWLNDYILWDSLFAKQPGQTMLVQETGLQRELNLDEIARRTPENEAALLERKVAGSFVQGAGAIEWLWNTNSYMTESNETPIGAVRPDGTEKPEAAVLREIAGFGQQLGPHLQSPEQAPIAIVTSQAAQYSVIAEAQLAAQRKVVRGLAYYDHLPAYAIAENQIAKLGSPKLAILPSPQALGDAAWSALLKYVSGGGNLLITGPVDRNSHWERVLRAKDLKLNAEAEPLTYHNVVIALPGRSLPLSFDQQAQNWLEALRFADGATFKEVPYGSGRIFWAAYPVELAEAVQPAADLYSYVAARAGVAPIFDLQSPLSPGVLVYPMVLNDSILYVILSDDAASANVDLRDKLTGARVQFRLPSQHGAMALIGKREKAVIARYGF
jgi:hypothetical protein